MKSYRIVESYPTTGKRGGKCFRVNIWRGENKEELKRQIKAYYALSQRKPYAEIVYYHGAQRIYDYEL